MLKVTEHCLLFQTSQTVNDVFCFEYLELSVVKDWTARPGAEGATIN